MFFRTFAKLGAYRPDRLRPGITRAIAGPAPDLNSLYREREFGSDRLLPGNARTSLAIG